VPDTGDRDDLGAAVGGGQLLLVLERGGRVDQSNDSSSASFNELWLGPNFKSRCRARSDVLGGRNRRCVEVRRIRGSENIDAESAGRTCAEGQQLTPWNTD
jgi:hypothetical protein